MNDRVIVNKIKAGDSKAVGLFFNNNKDPVYKTCLGYLQSKMDAEDLTQEVFLKAINKIGQFNHKSKLSTWLIRMAINMCSNYLRDNKKRLFSIELNNDIMDTNNAEIPKESRHIKELVRKSVYDLREKQKVVFILHYYLKLNYNEIANHTGYSKPSIESLLFRARKNIKTFLIKYSELTYK